MKNSRGVIHHVRTKTNDIECDSSRPNMSSQKKQQRNFFAAFLFGRDESRPYVLCECYSTITFLAVCLPLSSIILMKYIPFWKFSTLTSTMSSFASIDLTICPNEL